MLTKPFIKPSFALLSLCFALGGCYKPPYNNFRTDHRTVRTAATGTGIGLTAGLVSGYVVPGVAIGAAAGTAIGLYKDSRPGLIAELRKENIEYIEYGSTMTLIVPTDKYYEFNQPTFDNLEYKGLNAINKLLKYYPESPIYVAAFSDNIGSRAHKRKLTQGQAETMLTFLWSNGFKSAQLFSQGYGDDYPVGDNVLIHGSAFNRRVEIQFFKKKIAGTSPIAQLYVTK